MAIKYKTKRIPITRGITDHHRKDGLYACRGFAIHGDFLKATSSTKVDMTTSKTHIATNSSGDVRLVEANGTTITVRDQNGASQGTLADTATLANGGAYLEYKNELYFIVDDGTNTKLYKHNKTGSTISQLSDTRSNRRVLPADGASQTG